jgi:hypothetical protein
MMRRFLMTLAAGAVLAMPLAAAAHTGTAGTGAGTNTTGLTPHNLVVAGWTCFNVPGLGVHCAPPGKWPPTDPEVQLLYFFNLSDPNSDQPGLTGTESLIRDDMFKGQPCPTSPEGQFDDLSSLGLPYFGCHRS